MRATGALSRRSFLAAIAATPVLAADSWDEQDFPNWTPRTVERLLTDSPWARPLTVPFEYRPRPRESFTGFGDVELPGGSTVPQWPRGGTGRSPRTGGTGQTPRGDPVRTEVYLTVRWSSALPIRRALALDRWTREELNDAKAREFLERHEADYVVEIFGFPVAMVPQGTRRLEEELAGSAELSVRGHRTIRATRASVPEFGEHLSAELRFPRDASITPDDGALEFTAKTGAMKITTKFKLGEMVYLGRLEL